MVCFYPNQAYRSKIINKTGKRNIVFSKQNALGDGQFPFKLACGKCHGCRQRYTQQWAVRCYHESQLHEDCCFITLTFNDHFLPNFNDLDKRYFQKFMKRLRKMFPEKKIRYFHCGEYGAQYGRPHFHACLFGIDFNDKVAWKKENGITLYRSPTLEKLWSDPITKLPYGYSSIGNVTFQSAAYVARYIYKKFTGDESDKYYLSEYVDPTTGEYYIKNREYITMSRKPGIGYDWFQNYGEEVYPSDFVVINGQKFQPPKYYDKIYEIETPSDYEILKYTRIENAKKFSHDNTPERLRVKEKVALSKFSLLRRNLDAES